MEYTYNPVECAEVLPQDIATISEFVETSIKARQDVMNTVAQQVNMKAVTQSVEAACAALDDMGKLFASILGDPGDGPKEGTLHGAKKLADELAENIG